MNETGRPEPPEKKRKIEDTKEKSLLPNRFQDVYRQGTRPPLTSAASQIGDPKFMNQIFPSRENSPIQSQTDQGDHNNNKNRTFESQKAHYQRNLFEHLREELSTNKDGSLKKTYDSNKTEADQHLEQDKATANKEKQEFRETISDLLDRSIINPVFPAQHLEQDKATANKEKQKKQEITNKFIDNITKGDINILYEYFKLKDNTTKKSIREVLLDVKLLRHKELMSNNVYMKNLYERGFTLEQISENRHEESITKTTIINKFHKLTEYLQKEEKTLPNNIKELCNKYMLLENCFKINNKTNPN